MAGTAPVISTVENGSITNEKYADSSVSVSKLDPSLSKIVHYKFPDWVNGGMDAEGIYANNDVKFKRIDSKYYANAGDNIKINNSAYVLQIFRYKLDGTFIELKAWQENYTFTEECLFRITLYAKNSADLSSLDPKVLGEYVTANLYNQKPVNTANIKDKSINWNKMSDEMVRQYEDDIIYYGADEGVKVTYGKVSFDPSDPRLFYRTKDGIKQINLTTLEYEVPSDHSLVINKKTNVLEVINSNNIIRGTHLLLLAMRYKKVIKGNIRFKEKPDPNKLFPDYARPILNKYSFSFEISQDGCVVEDEIWLLHESLPGHNNTSDIYVLDKNTMNEKGTIRHNLGHGNGVDYRNGNLLVFNGATYPPEINLYANPYGKTSLLTTDSANTQIIFKEGEKRLEGDGTACFGENERIIYYNAGLTIYKILLGMGDNDLSDKTPNKTDAKRWGTFVSGKSTNEYNGTAQVLNVYKVSDGLSFTDLQPQGIHFDGYLYLVTGYKWCHAYKVQLLNDETFKVVDQYLYNHSDYKNAPIQIEPQCVFTINNHLFIGARRTGESFIVKMNL